MKNKIELLKQLGFSDEYLMYISEEFPQIINAERLDDGYIFEEINVYPTEVAYPIIDKTEEPVNSYVHKLD